MREKDYNLERIRMISFIMVIVIHVTNYFCRAFGVISTGEYMFSLILDTLSRVSVPCFFMITGALLLGREESLEKHCKRLLRFISVLAVWSAVYYFWNILYMKTPYDIREILYAPTEAHLWYLYAMIPIYCVMPFFQIMCRGMNRKMEHAFLLVITGGVIFNYIISLQNGEPYYDLPLIGDRAYSYYLFLGYYIYKYGNDIKKISQKTAAAVFGVCIALASVLTWRISVLRGEHYERVLEYGCPLIVIAAMAFFLFMIRQEELLMKKSRRIKQMIDACCGCSFGIYLIHILFLDTYKKHLEPETISAWIAVPGLIVGILAASFFCIYVLRKFKIGRKIT